MNKKKLSIIIPTLNEEKNIGQLISTISRQKVEVDVVIEEIIVVDNGSTDKTVEISRSLQTHVYVKPELTIGALRNFGANKAEGDILIFLDADNELEETVIQKIVAGLCEKNTGAIGIPLRPYGKPTWVERIWYYHIHTYKKGLNKAETIASGAFGIKKEIFIRAGGFDERLEVGEDTELSKRISDMGYNIYLDPECIIYNKGFPKTLYDFFKTEIWHGDSIKSVIIHKNIDLLTVYFVFCLLSIIIFVLSMIQIMKIELMISPIIVIVFPAVFKAVKRRKKVDAQFIQLLIIYSVYIIGRSISMIKF